MMLLVLANLVALMTMLSFLLSLLCFKICNYLPFIEAYDCGAFPFEPFFDGDLGFFCRGNKDLRPFLLSFCCSFQLLRDRAYETYKVLVMQK